MPSLVEPIAERVAVPSRAQRDGSGDLENVALIAPHRGRADAKQRLPHLRVQRIQLTGRDDLTIGEETVLERRAIAQQSCGATTCRARGIEPGSVLSTSGSLIDE